MARPDAITVEGLVVEALANGTWRVELANGHRLVAFMGGKTRAQLGRLAPGSTVRLELTPYDLSQGRITAEVKTV